MQVKFFTITIQQIQELNEEINSFLRSHKIVEIKKELIRSEKIAYWCIAISYTEHTISEKASKEKIDYIKILEPEIFNKFSKLRIARKEIANAENVSAFIVFTDAELAELAKQEISLANLKKIKGIGVAKVEKYGKNLIEKYLKAENEASIQPDAENLGV